MLLSDEAVAVSTPKLENITILTCRLHVLKINLLQ